MRRAILLSLASLALPVAASAQDPCADPAACCVHPGCVITDKQTLAGLTVDAVLPGVPDGLRVGQYVGGGDPLTGVTPAGFPENRCGLSYEFIEYTPEFALSAIDHVWLFGEDVPKVVDFGQREKTVIVVPSVDNPPFPEEAIESTVWGSDSPDLASFPDGWHIATLTTIWERGIEDPPECQGQDNADDFVGQYSFPGDGFRYVASYANYSISIFDDPSHATWVDAHDSNPTVPGWQSDDAETDAIAAPICQAGGVVVDAGAPPEAHVGAPACLDGTLPPGALSSSGWDLDGDGAIDSPDTDACFVCGAVGPRSATLFATDETGCVGSATTTIECGCPPVPQDGCVAPGGAKLALSAADGALRWSWTKGPATSLDDFANPLAGGHHRLCLYDESGDAPALVAEAGVDAGAGWKAGRRGQYQYKSKNAGGGADGVRSLLLKPGTAGKARIELRARGVALPALPLEQDGAVVAQLLQSTGPCYETRLDAPAAQNDARRFRDGVK